MNIEDAPIARGHLDENLSGPHQTQLTRLLSVPDDTAHTGAGTIEQPRISDRHILDAIAHAYDLLPEEHLWGDPTQVVMLAPQLPSCDDCRGLEDQFEIPSTQDRWAMALCCGCALERVGNPRLGPDSVQLLLLVDAVPAEVRELCEAVAAEIGQDSP